MSTAPESRVMTLLRQQRQLYGRLKRLAERQRSLVSSSDTSELLDVLRERNAVTERLVAIGAELSAQREEWSTSADCRSRGAESLPAEAREEIERMLAESQQVLCGILAGDDEDARRLAVQRDQTGRLLGEVCAGQNAVAAYSSCAQADSQVRSKVIDEVGASPWQA